MYYITFDGQYPLPAGENLAFATELFYRSVENGDWQPSLVDEEGVVLISFDSGNGWDEGDGFTIIIGPQVDRDWEIQYGGAWNDDPIKEEYEYKFGDWRL